MKYQRQELRQTVYTRTDDVGCEPYDSIAWAFDVHVKQPDRPEIIIAIAYGQSEDWPYFIDFFTEDRYDRKPDFSWELSQEDE